MSSSAPRYCACSNIPALLIVLHVPASDDHRKRVTALIEQP